MANESSSAEVVQASRCNTGLQAGGLRYHFKRTGGTPVHVAWRPPCRRNAGMTEFRLSELA